MTEPEELFEGYVWLSSKVLDLNWVVRNRRKNKPVTEEDKESWCHQVDSVRVKFEELVEQTKENWK